jgi:hypothetical protein
MQRTAKRAPAPIHLTKFVCLDCRTCFKRPVVGAEKRKHVQWVEVRTCPNCAGDAYLVGSDFKAPRKTDDTGWKVADFFIRAGLPYFRLYKPGSVPGAFSQVGAYPTDMQAAREFARHHAGAARPFFRVAETSVEVKARIDDEFRPL